MINSYFYLVPFQSCPSCPSPPPSPPPRHAPPAAAPVPSPSRPVPPLTTSYKHKCIQTKAANESRELTDKSKLDKIKGCAQKEISSNKSDKTEIKYITEKSLQDTMHSITRATE